ncbi:MAG: DUF58 domain-containing protein [Euryarchaeota archaeon]|nr:DUF58 domain-containing protein [Euryarchaeota archaeon]
MEEKPVPPPEKVESPIRPTSGLTRTGYSVLAAATTLMSLGLALGNYYFIFAGLFPLFLALVAMSQPTPSGFTVTREVTGVPARTGDRVKVALKLRCEKGRGLIEAYAAIPPYFELVDGTNIQLFAKGRSIVEKEWSFTIRVTKRGSYVLPPLLVESVHPLGFLKPHTEKIGEPFTLDVRPRLAPVRRIRGLAGIAKRPFPENDMAKIGIKSNEFREIREYVWGDPPKTINWKATARRGEMPGMSPMPLVNEYEREGKKTVFLFVDAAKYMEVGSSVENAFEYGLEAASGIAQYYLDRGYQLGAYFYNAAETKLIYPDSGNKQFMKVTQAAVGVQAGESREGLLSAVEKCKHYIVTGKPLVIIVTRPSGDVEATVGGIKRIRGILGRRKRRLPVLVIKPEFLSLMGAAGIAEADATRILAKIERPASMRVRKLGVSMIEWDPRKTSFAAAFVGRSL